MSPFWTMNPGVSNLMLAFPKSSQILKINIMRCFTSQRPGLWILIVSRFFGVFLVFRFCMFLVFFWCFFPLFFLFFCTVCGWCFFVLLLVFFCLPCLVWCFAIFLQSRLSNFKRPALGKFADQTANCSATIKTKRKRRQNTGAQPRMRGEESQNRIPWQAEKH